MKDKKQESTQNGNVLIVADQGAGPPVRCNVPGPSPGPSGHVQSHRHLPEPTVHEHSLLAGMPGCCRTMCVTHVYLPFAALTLRLPDENDDILDNDRPNFEASSVKCCTPYGASAVALNLAKQPICLPSCVTVL